MKKKNMAIMMAGVTVATTVAPAFAAPAVENDAVQKITVDTKDGKQLVSKVREILEVKYQEVKGNDTINVGDKVYEVKIGEDAITNASDLQNAIDKNQSVVVTITDNGHAKENSKVVNYKIEQYKATDEILAAVKDANKDLYAEATATDTVVVKLSKDAKESVTVKVGDNKVDFTDIKTTNSKLTGFGQLFTDIDSKVYEVTVNKTDAVDAKELFDGLRLTEKGTELVEAMTNPKEGYTVEVVVPTAENVDSPVVDMGVGAFKIVVKKDAAVEKTIIVSSEDAGLVKSLRALLNGDQLAVNLVAGNDRFDTAVAVSKQMFGEDKTTNNIVLVGEDAIVDGLAAAPLAKKVEAPVLLTKKDSLPAATEAEMLRVLGNDAEALKTKTVYIIGGESKISKELEAKIAKLGVKIKRLAGESRFETSLKIAEAVTTGATVKADETVFVVGGNGEADAMSISAKAAEVGAPIVVVDKNTVSEDAKKLLSGKQIEIIGGTGVVSEEVEKELKEIDANKEIVRLAGDTRQETNAKVINAHYTGDVNVAFIAKDGYVGGNGKLIDALTAAPLAAQAKAPIILTTENLTTEQSEVVELRLSKVKNLVQVGKGIADSAVQTILEKINFKK